MGINKKLKIDVRELMLGLDLAMNDIANKVSNDSALEVPVDTGDLQDDIHTEQVNTNKEITIKISYSLDYAKIQHESADFNHKIGKAFYLSDPFKKHSSKLKGEVQKQTKESVQNGNIIKSKIEVE